MSVFLGNLSGKDDDTKTNQSELELKQLLHDIKSPIMAVMAGVDYIQKNETSSDKAQDALNILKMATERLNSLTNKNQSIIAQLIPLEAIKSIASEKQFSGFKNIKISTMIPETTKSLGSVKEFKTMLSNLINNSIEAHSSQVQLTLTECSEYIRVAITDDGCGIAKNKLSFIGKRNAFSDKVGGQGLGLSHAVKTIKEWGGDLLIESQVGMGTTVTLLMKKA